MKYLEQVRPTHTGRLLGFRLQKSAKDHEYHDDEETERKKRVL